MFHGTQCVPQQITDTFLLYALSMARTCINGDDSASVQDVLVRLIDDVRYKHTKDLDELGLLGSGKVVALDAHWLLALQDLLDMIVINEAGDLYERFVCNHQLYSRVNYTRSKWCTNLHVSFRHPVYTYCIVLGLLNVKPSCGCSLEISQYCQCSLYSVIIVKAMEAS